MAESGKRENSVTLDKKGEEELERSPEVHMESKSHRSKKKKDDKDPEIEELKKKLEEKEKEAKENFDRLWRTTADFENYKKRALREKEDWMKFANEDLIKTILPFIDNLERAVNHAEKVVDTGVLIEGTKLTIQQILQALNRLGLTPFESIGKPFDPACHEAMLVVETDQHEPDHVVEEFQKGYLLNDRLLRPATVSVSKPPSRETLTLD